MSLCKNFIAFTLLTIFAFNINAAGIEKGDKTISIFGSLTSDDFSDTLTIFATGGIFYTDVIELQGSVVLIDSGNFSQTGLGGNVNLYLPGKNPDLVPYVGGGMQLVLSDTGVGSDTSIGLNAQAGIKQFISEEIAINYQAQLLNSSNYDAFILSVGITLFFE